MLIKSLFFIHMIFTLNHNSWNNCHDLLNNIIGLTIKRLIYVKNQTFKLTKNCDKK